MLWLLPSSIRRAVRVRGRASTKSLSPEFRLASCQAQKVRDLPHRPDFVPPPSPPVPEGHSEAYNRELIIIALLATFASDHRSNAIAQGPKGMMRAFALNALFTIEVLKTRSLLFPDKIAQFSATIYISRIEAKAAIQPTASLVLYSLDGSLKQKDSKRSDEPKWLFPSSTAPSSPCKTRSHSRTRVSKLRRDQISTQQPDWMNPPNPSGTSPTRSNLPPCPALT